MYGLQTASSLLLTGLFALLSSAASAETTQLWIANAWGEDLVVYEVGSWRPMKRLPVGSNPHGLAATTDGRTVYASLERFGEPGGELLWIDAQTFEILDRIEVGPEPNEIEVTRDGRFIYVPCGDGTWWVVDAHTKQVVKRIPSEGRPHNTTISPDGQFMYLSPLAPARVVQIVDIRADHRVIGTIPFSGAPRPTAISSDGHTLYQQVDGLVGFEVADIATRRVTHRITHPLDAELSARASRSHGLAVRPDQREIWSANVSHGRVHVHELLSGEFAQIAEMAFEGVPYWISFSLDGRYGFVSVLRSADRAQAAARVCAALAIFGLFAAGIAWRVHHRRADVVRLRGRLLRAATWTLLWSVLSVSLWIYARNSGGVVVVVDAMSREIVTELAAGNGPKRTQVVRVR